MISSKYSKGTRLKLIAPIEDPYTPKKAGDVLTVAYVDDNGQIHGSWASGGSIAIIPEKDVFEVIT